MNVLDPIFLIARCSTIFASDLPEGFPQMVWHDKVTHVIKFLQIPQIEFKTTLGAITYSYVS